VSREYRRRPYGAPSRENGKNTSAYHAAYYAENREQIRAHQKAHRAKVGSPHRVTHRQYKAMVISLLRQRDGDACGICRCLLGSDVQIDHVVQRALGGTEAAENLRLLHRECHIHLPKKRGRTNG
jgi:5-methylcytosine-specific restriction endonuclease McrA